MAALAEILAHHVDFRNTLVNYKPPKLLNRVVSGTLSSNNIVLEWFVWILNSAVIEVHVFLVLALSLGQRKPSVSVRANILVSVKFLE